MNIRLLKKVRDAIADEATPFDMSDWGVKVTEHSWHADCGTPACIAGWAIRLGMRRRKTPPDPEDSVNINHQARQLLRLDFDVAWNLFHTYDWPAWTERYKGRFRTHRKGALLLLDMLIEGRDPWTEEP